MNDELLSPEALMVEIGLDPDHAYDHLGRAGLVKIDHFGINHQLGEFASNVGGALVRMRDWRRNWTNVPLFPKRYAHIILELINVGN